MTETRKDEATDRQSFLDAANRRFEEAWDQVILSAVGDDPKLAHALQRHRQIQLIEHMLPFEQAEAVIEDVVKPKITGPLGEIYRQMIRNIDHDQLLEQMEETGHYQAIMFLILGNELSLNAEMTAALTSVVFQLDELDVVADESIEQLQHFITHSLESRARINAALARVLWAMFKMEDAPADLQDEFMGKFPTFIKGTLKDEEFDLPE